MAAGVQSRVRQWPLILNGYTYPILNDKEGRPHWEVSRIPDIAGHTTGVQDIERAYRSTHSGYGWSQYQAPNTYHYATSGSNGSDAAGGVDARFPGGQIILGPLVSSISQTSKDATVGVTGFFEYGSYLYTISGKWVNRIDPTNDSVAAAGGFPHDLTGTVAGAVGTVGMRFDGNVVIGMTTASGADMVAFDGSTTFTQLNTGSPPRGIYLAKYWEDTDYRLAVAYVSSSNPSVAWIAQGAALEASPTNWGAAYGVGDQSSTITGLVAVDRTLYIAMSDGLYQLDGQAGRAPLIVPAMPVASTNGVNTFATEAGNVIYPCASGIYEFDSANGIIDNIAPGRGLPDRSGIAGTYTAFASFRAWLFCAVYDGTHSYIMAGRRREDGEPGYGPYIWHGSLAKIASTKVTSMHVSSLVSPPRLYFGLLSGNVAYIKLPDNGDNPLLDSDYRYAASGTIVFPADDFDVGGMRWQLSSVVIETEGMDANTYVEVLERRDLNSGTAQVETATVLGTIGAAGAGNATVIVTAANMPGTPKTVSVAVANNDTASQVGGKIRTALATDATVGAFFYVSGSGANVVLTVKNVVANDGTMNISIDNGTCTGLTAAPTSTNTTAGVTAWTSLQTVTSNGRTTITLTTDKRFSRCELRLDFTNASSGSTPVVRVLAGRATRRPTLSDVIDTTVILDDEAISKLGIGTRFSAKTLSDQLDTLDAGAPITMKTYWLGPKELSQTVLVTNLKKRILYQAGEKTAIMAASLQLRVVA